MSTTPMKRCAIYTRKSSDEGLEQAFNSLDAQWEAGAAYIMSQKHLGWVLVDQRFDDGGFSGGNIERPALKKLMAAVERDEIDIIVVYKVDRLTRSLTDFAKLVGILDEHNVSFISVTQPLNTTDSMGRLTLHMLLSFAQFEREITGERIRDKFAESKKKGIWMGGQVPLGYEVKNRKLVVHPGEKAMVQLIFKTFIETKSLSETSYRINDMGLRTKRYLRKDGSIWGGRRFIRNTVLKLLKNQVYLGLIHHKGVWYQGQHDAILDQETWDKAQAIFKVQGKQRRSDSMRMRSPAFLRGLLFGPDGIALVPTSSQRRGKRYRFYTSNTGIKQGYRESPIPPLPAQPLEAIIIGEIQNLLDQPQFLMEIFASATKQASDLTLAETASALKAFSTIWAELFPYEQQRIVQLLIERIDIKLDGIRIRFMTDGLQSFASEITKPETRSSL